MLLRLSPRQIAACRHWLTPRHREFFEPVKLSPKRHEVAMPAAAWRSLAEVLFVQAFRPSGRSDGRAPAGTRSALHAIARGQARTEGHPAMRMELVQGYCPDTLTAWLQQDGASYSPYPMDGAPMVVLVPFFHDRNVFVDTASGTMFTSDVTSWEPQDPADWTAKLDGLFLDPADHEGWA